MLKYLSYRKPTLIDRIYNVVDQLLYEMEDLKPDSDRFKSLQQRMDRVDQISIHHFGTVIIPD